MQKIIDNLRSLRKALINGGASKNRPRSAAVREALHVRYHINEITETEYKLELLKQAKLDERDSVNQMLENELRGLISKIGNKNRPDLGGWWGVGLCNALYYAAVKFERTHARQLETVAIKAHVKALITYMKAAKLELSDVVEVD